MGGDLSPRGTETEKQLQLAHDEGEQRECLELMKEEKSEQFLYWMDYHRWNRTIHCADTALKSPGVLNHNSGLET